MLNSLKQELQLIAQQYDTAIQHIGQQCKAVRVYGLQLKDIDTAWKDIKRKVDSTMVTKTVFLSSFQLKYLQHSQAACINAIKAVAEVCMPDPPETGQKQQINITAMLCDIIKLVNKLKKAISMCMEEHIQFFCSHKHVMPWKKRWDVFVQDQCSQKHVYIQYCIDGTVTDSESGVCTVSFDICSDNSVAIEEVKNIIANVENGQAFSEHTVTLSQRESEYLQKHNSAVANLLQQAHNVFIELQTSDNCSVTILVASDLDSVKLQQIGHSLSKHFKDLTIKKIKFLDTVAGTILLKEKAHEIEKCYNRVAFAYHKHTEHCVVEMQGLVADINAAEEHIKKEVAQIKTNVVETDQLILKKTSLPLLSSSMGALEEDQLLTCSYPTISYRETLVSVKCIQTVSGRIMTIELCDCNTEQIHPDAVLCTKGTVCTDSEVADGCVENDNVTVTCLPDLLDSDMDISTPKCKVCVSTNNCPSLSKALLAGLKKIHHKKYGVIEITSCSTHKTSPKWLLAVLNSLGQYAMLHPDTSIHTVRVVLISPIMHTKKQFDQYSFSNSTTLCTNSTFSSSDKSASKKMPTKPRWYWEDHGKYSEYDQAASDRINSAWVCDNQGKCQLIINSQIYIIDFKHMTQTNQTTKFSRSIRFCRGGQSSLESHGRQSTSAVRWSYLDDSGNFSCYTSSQSKQIEAMYLRTLPVTTLSINEWEYAFDFERMVQINTITDRERPIKREPKSTEKETASCVGSLKTIDPNETVVLTMRGHSSSIKSAKECINETIATLVVCEEIPVPLQLVVDAEFFQKVKDIVDKLKYIEQTVITKDSSTQTARKVIEMRGEKELLQKARNQLQTEIIKYVSTDRVPKEPLEYPLEWEPQQKSCQLFSVRHHSTEWRRIASLLRETMQNVKVIEIRQIQNKVLWEKYQQDKKRICEKNNGNANEKELFHGSRKTKAEDIVKCEDGLDMRWSAEGMWGRANYFAVKANYSDSYAYERKDGMKEMIVAKVLTGDSYTSPPDSSLRMPPEKPRSSRDDLKVKYDTVNGVTSGSTVYMTYSNEKAYPAYIIIYIPKHISSEDLNMSLYTFSSTASSQRQSVRQAPAPPSRPPVHPVYQAPAPPSRPPVHPVYQALSPPSRPPVRPVYQAPSPPSRPPVGPVYQAPSPSSIPPVRQAPVRPSPPAPAKEKGCALM